jgi:hypothetical protein
MALQSSSYSSSSTAAAPLGFPALTITSPLLIALMLQSALYCTKNRSRTCGFYLPDGFPVDPACITALFVAARVDELIMWDWNVVLWCPYLIWVLALYNSFVYGIVAFDVVRTHRAQSERPVQEQHYAMLVAPNTYVRPYWLAVRSVLRFVVALTVTVCVFVSVRYGALRLNGAVDTVSMAAVTLPLAVALGMAGALTLATSWIVAPRLVTMEPHRCSYCTRPIRLLLQVGVTAAATTAAATTAAAAVATEAAAASGGWRNGESGHGGEEKKSNIGRNNKKRVVRVLRYENPLDTLTIDLAQDDDGGGGQDDTTDGAFASSTVRRAKDGVVPLRLVRAVGKAMWKEFRGGLDVDKGGGFGGGGGGGNGGNGGNGGGGGNGGNGGSGGSAAKDAKDADEDPQQMCTICRSRPADCVFLDCGHAVQCWDCSRHVIRSRNRQRRRQQQEQFPGGGGPVR